MIRFCCLLSLLLVLTGCQSNKVADVTGWNHYGLTEDKGGDYVALGAFQGDETNVVVEGIAMKTCKTSGCWVTIKDDHGDELFVQCQDEQYHLPRNLIGHRVVAHGNAKVHVISVAELKHFAEVAGEPQEKIDAITEPEHLLMLIADAIWIEGEGLDQPYTVEEAEAACEAAHGPHADEH
jgi:hypothetical protein